MKKQEFKSAGTSINSKKVPAVFSRVEWRAGTKNLDWGGGKYDTACEFMEKIGCQNVIYDPFNRTPEENEAALAGAPYDTVTISNVLNVVKEKGTRVEIVKEALRYLKEGGIMYVTVYEGDGGGVGRETKKGCWQCNKRLREYAQELKEAQLRPSVVKNMIMIRR